MINAKQIMDKLTWDPNMNGTKKIGYWDRVLNKIIYKDYSEILSRDDFSFQLMDEEGYTNSIPYHRLREVLHNDIVIWKR